MAVNRMMLAAGAVAIVGGVAAFSVLNEIDEAEEQTQVAKTQGETLEGEEDDHSSPPASSANAGLAGFWSGGNCTMTASSQGDSVHDVSTTPPQAQMFPLIINPREDGSLYVDPHPMDAERGVTLSWNIEGDRVHAEEAMNEGSYMRIRDFTVQGDKLAGTYVIYDTRVGYRKEYRCVLPRA